MGLLKDQDRKHLQRAFEKLDSAVKLVMFTQELECEYCQVTREMAQEIATVSGKISVDVKDFVKDAEAAKGLGIDKIPALAVMGDKDYGIRFYGIPAGYEFTTLIEDILDVSRRDHGLSPAVLAELSKVDKPVRMEVLVSPT